MGMHHSLLGLALLVLAACESHSTPPLELDRPDAPIVSVDLAPIQVRIERVDLSGARKIDDAANQNALVNLENALTDALHEAGIQIGVKPLPFESLALSRHVLRSVDPDRSDRAHLTTFSAWAIDIPNAAERAPPPVLIVFAEARINSAGHKLAQAGLSLALLAPEGIDGGTSRIHAGLFDGETGELIWATHLSRGDVTDPAGAQTVADQLVARLEAELK